MPNTIQPTAFGNGRRINSKQEETIRKKNMKTINVKQEIDRRNKQFKGASNAQKRVLIAKDVIEQIKAKRFIPESGTWVDFNKQCDTLLETDSIQEKFLDKTIKDCNCCALGGLMMSCTLFNNRETVSDIEEHFEAIGDNIDYGTKFHNKFDKIFSRSQLLLIEKCFEGGVGYFSDYNHCDFEGYRSQFKNATAALIGIMENIIKNKGTFKPVFDKEV